MKAILSMITVAGMVSIANADVVSSNASTSWPASPGTGSYVDTLGVPAAASIDFISVWVAHTWSSDLIISIAGPDGSTFSLLNRPGTSSRDLGVLEAGSLVPAEYFFVESGANAWGSLPGTQIPSGAANSYNALSWTAGPLSAGDYTISVTDNIGGDGGTIAGWSIGYSPVPAPGAVALLGLGGLMAGRRRRA